MKYIADNNNNSNNNNNNSNNNNNNKNNKNKNTVLACIRRSLYHSVNLGYFALNESIRPSYSLGRREGNVLFNDSINGFYL